MSSGGKFLVLYASFGSGHERAAHAVRDGILKIHPGAQADVLDYFLFTNPTLYNLVRKTYLQSLRVAPGLWGRFYHRTSHVSGRSPINKILNKIGRKNFIDYLCLTTPDAVITTYPVPAGVLSDLKGRGLFNTPVVTAITDFGIHSQWLHPHTDLYLVGTGLMKENLVERGIPAEKIFVSGIPVSPVFNEQPDKSSLYTKLGLNPAIPTVLILGGAPGFLTGMTNVCSRLAQAPVDLQLLVVCGRDTGMYNEFLNTVKTQRNCVKIFPFVNNIHELMTVSDLAVTKAGGLTVSEALAKRLPMVIFRPLPGQEEENTRYLTESGAALAVKTETQQLADTILSLINEPPRLKAMAAAADSIRQADSASRAAQKIGSLMNNFSRSSRNY
ncbi:glycosyltransferase, partial [bacterium]